MCESGKPRFRCRIVGASHWTFPSVRQRYDAPGCFEAAPGQERSVDRVWFGDGQAVAVNLDIEPAEDMRWVDPTHPTG